eukprot:scaffold32609_cov20-Tisochrysis_lutea.AAC.2
MPAAHHQVWLLLLCRRQVDQQRSGWHVAEQVQAHGAACHTAKVQWRAWEEKCNKGQGGSMGAAWMQQRAWVHTCRCGAPHCNITTKRTGASWVQQKHGCNKGHGVQQWLQQRTSRSHFDTIKV